MIYWMSVTMMVNKDALRDMFPGVPIQISLESLRRLSNTFDTLYEASSARLTMSFISFLNNRRKILMLSAIRKHLFCSPSSFVLLHSWGVFYGRGGVPFLTVTAFAITKRVSRHKEIHFMLSLIWAR